MSILNIPLLSKRLKKKKKKIPKLSLFASRLGAMINHQWLNLPITGTNIHGPKEVLVIEV